MNPVISSIARTPIGRFNGAYAPLKAVDLGAVAIAGALDRSGLSPESVDEVIFGHVLQAGQGQITSRQAAVKAGIPMTVPAVTINKVCLSGMTAIQEAANHIRLGESTFVVAGGMESMTNAPYVLAGARSGYRMGDQAVVDVDDARRAVLCIRFMHDGRLIRPQERRSPHRSVRPGRVVCTVTREGRRSNRQRCVRSRDHPRGGTPAQGRDACRHRGRRNP